MNPPWGPVGCWLPPTLEAWMKLSGSECTGGLVPPGAPLARGHGRPSWSGAGDGEPRALAHTPPPTCARVSGPGDGPRSGSTN